MSDMAKHTFRMHDSFEDNRNGTPHSTHVVVKFETDQLDDLVHEFKCYLWHCGYTYVEEVEVHTKSSLDRKVSEKIQRGYEAQEKYEQSD